MDQAEGIRRLRAGQTCDRCRREGVDRPAVTSCPEIGERLCRDCGTNAAAWHIETGKDMLREIAEATGQACLCGGPVATHDGQKPLCVQCAKQAARDHEAQAARLRDEASTAQAYAHLAAIVKAAREDA
jgi:hypothetical protein